MLTRSSGNLPVAWSLVSTFENADVNCSTMQQGTMRMSASSTVWPPRWSVLPTRVPWEWPCGVGSEVGLIGGGRHGAPWVGLVCREES